MITLSLYENFSFTDIHITINGDELVKVLDWKKLKYGRLYNNRNNSMVYFFTRDDKVHHWETENIISPTTYNKKTYSNHRTLNNIKEMLKSNPTIFEDFDNFEMVALVANL